MTNIETKPITVCSGHQSNWHASDLPTCLTDCQNRLTGQSNQHILRTMQFRNKIDRGPPAGNCTCFVKFYLTLWLRKDNTVCLRK